MEIKILFIILITLPALAFTSCVVSNNTSSTQNVTNSTMETLKEPEGDVEFSFIVYGDNGNINPVFEKIISEANKSDADFVVGLGDSSDGKNKKELQDVKNFLEKKLEKKYYTAIGDNDYILEGSKRTSKAFEEVFGKKSYSFDHKGAHFIVFESTDQKDSFADEELDWLKKDLKKNTSKRNFIFMHVPINAPMSEITLGEQSELLKQQNRKFTEIVNEYKVEEIYSGHFHGYLTYDLENVPVTISGGAGSSPQFGFDPDYHYIKVDVYKNTHRDEYKKIEDVAI
ncbi:MAG: metallophosphoesterase [uncultured bacterium]|nr:MAG: metallophosphoesterase [uncultured bacterium]